MGIYGDKRRDLIYTSSMDGFFKASHRTTKKTMYVDSIDNLGLTTMHYISERLFVGTT